MHSLENDVLQISVHPRGAELKTLYHKGYGLHYLWSGDAAVWGKTSPVLFPIVGTLKENRYTLDGAAYALPRHGFAREKDFRLEAQTADSLCYTLDSDADTLSVFPFPFRFSIRYRLQSESLEVQYTVSNTGNGRMLFSLGGHPAFRLPLVQGTDYGDYRLQFEEKETVGRWPITKEGLLGTVPEPLLADSDVLPLQKGLFQKDAIVLKHLRSSSVALRSDKTPRGLQLSFPGFPFLGLWAAPGADFICIEPWCGHADSIDADGELWHKDGIEALEAGASFERSWTVTVF